MKLPIQKQMKILDWSQTNTHVKIKPYTKNKLTNNTIRTINGNFSLFENVKNVIKENGVYILEKKEQRIWDRLFMHESLNINECNERGEHVYINNVNKCNEKKKDRHSNYTLMSDIPFEQSDNENNESLDDLLIKIYNNGDDDKKEQWTKVLQKVRVLF